MSAPAEIAGADEAIKTLVRRFKAAPGSAVFTELASALLARGHAAEALRVTEHGLQLVPDSVEGRVQRAAALLAQGRPRMAYVELLRALAIDPAHRRAQRLLGKAYVDAGAPERAAQLLAKRSQATATRDPEPVPPSSDLTSALIDDLTDAPVPTSAAGRDHAEPGPPSDLPELFSALTQDLGLGAAVPETAPRRVEVTQIIRRKARPRPPRSASELAEIDGPIVDTTQPGHVVETEDEPAPTVTTKEPSPLFASHPDLASLALDDEPLFQENMPFAVRPVDAPSEDLPTVEPQQLNPQVDDTVVEQIESYEGRASAPPTPVVPAALVPSATPAPTRVSELTPATPPLVGTLESPPPARAATAPRGAPDELIPPARATPTAPMAPWPASGPQRSPPPPTLDAHRKSRPSGSNPIPAADTAPLPAAEGGDAAFGGSIPVVERHRPRYAGRLVVESPPPDRGRLALAAGVAVAMALYFVGWAVVFADRLAVWWTD